MEGIRGRCGGDNFKLGAESASRWQPRHRRAGATLNRANGRPPQLQLCELQRADASTGREPVCWGRRSDVKFSALVDTMETVRTGRSAPRRRWSPSSRRPPFLLLPLPARARRGSKSCVRSPWPREHAGPGRGFRRVVSKAGGEGTAPASAPSIHLDENVDEPVRDCHAGWRLLQGQVSRHQPPRVGFRAASTRRICRQHAWLGIEAGATAAWSLVGTGSGWRRDERGSCSARAMAAR